MVQSACKMDEPRRDGDPGEGGTTNAASFVTAALLQRFLDEARDELATVQAAARPGADREQAAAVLHRWIGSAGLLGLGELCRAATETKTLLRRRTEDDDRRARDLIALMESMIGAGENPEKEERSLRG